MERLEFSGLSAFVWNIFGYQYLKLRPFQGLSLPRPLAAGPSHSQRHGRRWFPILIPKNILCTWRCITRA